MSDEKRLRALLKLLDDESVVVQTEVARALKGYGSRLEQILSEMDEEVDPQMIDQVLELIGASEDEKDVEQPESDEPVHKAHLRIGQLVVHRNYHYRGVIVHGDPRCGADEMWYRSNQTQPERNQPWYHVLVHGSSQVTYAAESNLEVDSSSSRIVHPFVAHFFDRFENGRYVRNDQPWPDIWNL